MRRARSDGGTDGPPLPCRGDAARQGYLFLSVMLNENSDMMRLTIQSIKTDLQSRNELFVCLALTCLANIGSREMAESLSSEVTKLLVSADSTHWVRKKAALALLRLYRKAPEVIPSGDYAARVIKLMEDTDLGVLSAVLSMMQSFVPADPGTYAPVVDMAIARLAEINTRKDAALEGYMYYRVPAPWLQVKLLRLIMTLPPPAEGTPQRASFMDVLRRILARAVRDPVRDRRNKEHTSQYFNARNAVLYDAIQAIIYLETERDILMEATNLLGTFLASKETNLRYFALELMTRLAVMPFSHDSVKVHQAIVIASLEQEKDNSVRLRALDLLYNLCDTSNARVIVQQMLQYLTQADYEIREEIVLKIAVLAEQYAEDFKWYIDVIISLMQTAGENVSDEVWHRVIQIVTNRTEIQAYATRMAFNALKSDAGTESLTKLGAYILGEFGNLIADEPQSGPMQQFSLLHSKYPMCSTTTRALLLSTYAKFANLFPEIKPHIERVFAHDTLARSIDLELQQRAAEYMALSRAPDTVAQMVFEEMPKYEERQSGILAKLRTSAGTPAASASAERGGRRRASGVPAQTSDAAVDGGGASAATAAPTAPASATLLDLLGTGESAPSAPPATSTANLATVSPRASEMVAKFITANEGVLYEDECLAIGTKAMFKDNRGQIMLYYANRSRGAAVTSLTLAVEPASIQDTFSLAIKPIGQLPLAPGAQTSQAILVECQREFGDSPVATLAYTCGSTSTRVALYLPLFLNKFCDNSVTIDRDTFAARWRNLSGPGLESQMVMEAQQPMEADAISARVRDFGFAVCPNVDSNPDNVVGIAILKIGSRTVGCLLRLEPNRQTKVRRGESGGVGRIMRAPAADPAPGGRCTGRRFARPFLGSRPSSTAICVGRCDAAATAAPQHLRDRPYGGAALACLR